MKVVIDIYACSMHVIINRVGVCRLCSCIVCILQYIQSLHTERYVSQQSTHPEKYIQEMYTLYNVQDEIYETQYELCVYKQFAHYSKGILQYVYSTYRMQQIVCLFPCSV